ncbi:hypothetical protein P154DRAFT_537502 [Amniculicola lignicola CBS 123094]|uniref:F-box domain-containing protein n=1 Tax=Amniculicola lignicola CBS 123094 TaxID=1392246 RepID=A0A6A5W8A9_9PLEO|nr:hypothetical protein P154DRAFT_537502 [Amniculicola lignicola CBS 123094]
MPVSSRRKRRGSPPPAAPPVKKSRASQRIAKRKSVEALRPAPPTHDNETYIDRLPDEVLLLVLEQLRPCCCRTRPRKDFHSLSLTSRRLGRLANNFLYEFFDSDTHDNARFTRTLIANPDLASRVKSMYWSIEPHAYPPMPKEKYIPTDKDKREFRQSVRQLGMPNRGICLQLYQDGKVQDLFTVSLIHTPNIRELAIQDKSLANMNAAHTILQRELLGPILKAAQNKPVGNLPTYNQLSVLDIQMPYMRLEEVVQLFRLKSLRKLTLDGVNASQTIDIAWDMHTSGVRELIILHSCIDSGALAQLVNLCKQLTVIVCQFSPLFCAHTAGDRAKVNYALVSKALAYHKEWVELIDIDDVSDRSMDTYDRGQLASFHDYEKLAVLGIPFEALPKSTVEEKDFPIALFDQILPPNLQLFGPVVFEEEEDTNDCEHALKHLASLLRAELKKQKAMSPNSTPPISPSISIPPIAYKLGGGGPPTKAYSVRSGDTSSPPPPPRPASSILPALQAITLRLDRYVHRRHIHVPSFTDLPVKLRVLQNGREIRISHHQHHHNSPPHDLPGPTDPHGPGPMLSGTHPGVIFHPYLPANAANVQLGFPPPTVYTDIDPNAEAIAESLELYPPSPSHYSTSLTDSLDGFAWDEDVPLPAFSDDDDFPDDEATAADFITAALAAGIPVPQLDPAMGSVAVMQAIQEQIVNGHGGDWGENGELMGIGGGGGAAGPAIGGVGLGWNAGVWGDD